MNKIGKRAFDIVCAVSGLLLSMPLWALISFLIYLEDGRPIFFLQERVGKNETRFNIIKFRTMLKSAQPHKGIDLLDSDARLTKMGKVLRATAMDELPQLINILKGQMSFVGPKPLPYLIADGEAVNFNNISEVPGFATRINVLPGLTGIAQIYAPKTISRRNKFRYDNLYIKRQSLFLDLYLIGLSILITFKGKWESKSKFSRKKGNA